MTTPTIEPLADALPGLDVGQAALQRLAFDSRFERWLSTCLGDASLKVMPGGAEQALGTQMLFMVPGGSALIESDLNGWPAAKLLLRAQDQTLACRLAEAYFSRAIDALGAVGVGAGVASIRVNECGVAPRVSDSDVAAAVTIVASGFKVVLRSCDGVVLERAFGALQSVAPDVVPLLGLQLIGHLRLYCRSMQIDVLASLERGDVLIFGAAVNNARAPSVLQFGTGITMQVPTEIDYTEKKATAVASPSVGPDDIPPGPAVDTLPPGVSELMLPVAFEIETAALSLGELASIKPGYVVELATPLMEAAVRLVCHGQTIGSGQLIAIGGQLGVRIDRVSIGRHDASAQR
jgi:type III secretion protein Q